MADARVYLNQTITQLTGTTTELRQQVDAVQSAIVQRKQALQAGMQQYDTERRAAEGIARSTDDDASRASARRTANELQQKSDETKRAYDEFEKAAARHVQDKESLLKQLAQAQQTLERLQTDRGFEEFTNE